jgi:hypothetical protein
VILIFISIESRFQTYSHVKKSLMVRLQSAICRGPSLWRAGSCMQCICAFTIGTLCLLTILFLKSMIIVLSTLSHSDASNDFNCHSWKTLPSFNTTKYEQRLRWTQDGRFWPLQHLRHTAFKHLLNSSSLIVEVGGNVGHDTDRYITLYNASIITFEPLYTRDNLCMVGNTAMGP